MAELIPYLLIAALVIGVITLVVLIMLLRKNKSAPEPKIDPAILSGVEGRVSELKGSLSALSTIIKKDIEITVKDEVSQIAKQNVENIDKSNERLTGFQKNLTATLEQRLEVLTKQVNEALLAINKRVDDRLDAGLKSTNENVTKVIESLAQIEAARKNIEALQGQVVNLSDILSNNQKRGKFGEFTLQKILESVFGAPSTLYEMQYILRITPTDSIKPDAVVFLPEPNKLVCIDSKFPFINYQQIYQGKAVKDEVDAFKTAVKNHINAISEKYIIVEKTAPQALMFVPSDGIYAQISADFPNLIDYALKKNVILCSPATLHPMLVSIHGLIIQYKRAQALEAVEQLLAKLAVEFKRFSKRWFEFEKTIISAHNKSNELSTTVAKINNNFKQVNTSEFEQDEEVLIENEEE